MGQTAIAVSANHITVKVSTITSNLKNVRFSLVVSTCNDTVTNANETGVDCGGWCAPQKKCANLMSCHDANDCISGACTLNICQSNDKNVRCKVFELVCRSSHL